MELNEALKVLNNSNADPRLLARIAYENEDLQLSVVQHQGVYPQLLKWLALFGNAAASDAACVKLERQKMNASENPVQTQTAQQFSGQFSTQTAGQPQFLAQNAQSYGQNAQNYGQMPATGMPQQQTGMPSGMPQTAMQQPAQNTPMTQTASSHNYTVVQALDPNLDLDVMCDIATRAPELREYIARNRSAYPTLLQWLASLNDPAINQALKMRS
jgi:hypothetical protein